jgi:long-chain acyl-CoA synthetase
MSFRSIPRRFHDWVRVQPDAPAYYERSGGRWVPTDWRTYTGEVRAAARALMALGCEPGTMVAIMGFNAPSWTISDLAAMTAGGIPVGVYANSSLDQVGYILGHSGARFLVVEGMDAWRRIDSGIDRPEDLEHVILMRGSEAADDPRVLSWERFLEHGTRVSDADLDRRMDGLRPGDVGALIYTSGTTGPPKGSMLSHGALAAATDMGIELLPDPHIGARLLSYLPMAHAAERALTLLGPASYGYTVFYAESIEAMAANLREVEPEIFLGVPRVWQKIRTGVEERIDAVRGPRRRLIEWARSVALRFHEERCRGVEPHGSIARKYRWARRLVLDRIRTAVGLGRSRVLLSGAAPMSEEDLRALASLDMPVREVYGQTEDCGPTTNNRPGETRWGSVGRPFRGCEMRIAGDGEVLVRGPHLFSGYYRDPEASAEALRDGWLHTGDLGFVDADGYLFITGRKKEIIITSGGKNVAPRNLEEAIRESPLVEDVVLVGDARKYLGALVTLGPGPERAFQAGPSATVPRHTDPHVLTAIWEHVERVNERFSRLEHVRRIMVLPGRFTVRSGELTPTLKVRRETIARHYAKEIDLLYSGTPLDGTGVVPAADEPPHPGSHERT